MARMEIDCNFCLGKLAKTLIIVYSVFENLLDIFLLVFYKHFVYEKGTF